VAVPKAGVIQDSQSRAVVDLFLLVGVRLLLVVVVVEVQVALLQDPLAPTQEQVVAELLFFHMLSHNWSFINESFC
jgi:hypothetical protein